jgi:hypothetical protein
MRQAVPRFDGTSDWKRLVEEDPDIAPLRAEPEFQKIVTEVKQNAAVKEKGGRK